MRLTSLQPVCEAAGPFASAYVDVSRADSDSAHHRAELLWREAEEGLLEEGAPPQVVERVGERMVMPIDYGGQFGRGVVAAGDRVLLDEPLPGGLVRGHAAFGPVPHLMPLVEARATDVPYVLVKADHAGADIFCVTDAVRASDKVESGAGHDVLHKVPGGGWSHRRYQNRAADSWDRNAARVAADLDSIAAQHNWAMVFLAGEPYSVSAIRDHSSGRAARLLVDLEHGSRAAGSSDHALGEEIADALERYRQAVSRRTVEEFATRVGKDQAVANGQPRVVDALRGGAVETLLLAEGATSTRRIAAGPDPLHLGIRHQDVTTLGVDEVFEDRADEVMLRALIAQDGEIQLFEDEPEQLRDGVGALLRFDHRAQRVEEVS